MKAKVIAIVGPTASGKTALSIELSKIFNGEVVSADSMAVYRLMDIGTAKPNETEREQALFHLIDICDPKDDYNVGLFQQDAHRIIDDIISREKVPIVCGGSGLYIKAACVGLDLAVPESDPKIRVMVNRVLNRRGLEFLCDYIKSIDPVIYESLDKQNSRRVTRAIEIYKTTNIIPSEVFKLNNNINKRPDFITIGLTMPREILRERIDKRVDNMIEMGLEDEVRFLIKRGCSNTAIQGIGYKEMADYINGQITYDEAVERIKISTRQFAKRQYTWFKKDTSIIWIDVINKNISQIIDEITKVVI